MPPTYEPDDQTAKLSDILNTAKQRAEAIRQSIGAVKQGYPVGRHTQHSAALLVDSFFPEILKLPVIATPRTTVLIKALAEEAQKLLQTKGHKLSRAMVLKAVTDILYSQVWEKEGLTVFGRHVMRMERKDG